MKLVFVLFILMFSVGAIAESLKDCTLFVAGKVIEEVEPFDIEKYSSDEPEATIDGNLIDFTRTAKAVEMAFSNECDNIYEIKFGNAAIAKAKAGIYKTLIGRATIGNANLEKPFTGTLKCTVQN